MRAERVLPHGNERLTHAIALKSKEDGSADFPLDRNGCLNVDFAENEHEVGLFRQPSCLQPGFRSPSENPGGGRKALSLVRRRDSYL